MMKENWEDRGRKKYRSGRKKKKGSWVKASSAWEVLLPPFSGFSFPWCRVIEQSWKQDLSQSTVLGK